MNFEDVLNQAISLIERQGRVSYRALMRQFSIDEPYLDDLKSEIIDVLKLAVDEDGKMLVWRGDTSAPRAHAGALSNGSAPAALVAARTPDLPVAQPARVPRQAERRNLTMMFCDLVGSTAMSAQLDPEDLREVVRAYQKGSAEVIARFDGHIAQYLGDGILVYFGFPVAHEDDAWRALQSGLEIIAGMEMLNQSMTAKYGVTLAVRIGVHTGQVVIGEMGAGNRHENLALGETPNIAARIQSLAEPNTVFASRATMQLVPGRFVVIPVDSPLMKGVAQPVEVSRVVEALSTPSWLDGTGTVERTALVGRKSEALLLQARWAQCHDGNGQAVVLTGEPGIGKSRLVGNVREHALASNALCIEWQCSAHHANNALYPVIRHVERVLCFERGDSHAVRFAKIEGALARYKFPNARSAPLLASLLSVTLPADLQVAPHNPQQDKQHTFELLTEWMAEDAGERSVLFVVEDLQWCDPSTVELLGLVIEQIPTSRTMALLTSRPEFQPPWPPSLHLSFLALDRLPRAQIETMIADLLGGASLPAEVVDQIIAKTDGIPLFVEELVKMLLGSDLLRPETNGYGLRGPLPPLAIPATLQDSLMARLDRLSSTRETVQLAAAIGREFSFELISAVSPLDEDTLRLALGQLVKAELIYRRGSSANSVYLFKHALILDAAYQSLLKSSRQVYHEKIAIALETQFATVRDTQPALLAHHWSEAGLTTKAIDYWQKAGQRAIERSANLEAINALSRGLALAESLPEGLLRIQQELSMRVTIGMALVATKGYAAADVERTYTRAHELSLQLEESAQVPNILWGLWVFYLTGGPLDMAIRIAGQYQAIAEKRQESALLLETCQLIGIPRFYMGEFAEAQPYLARGAALYDAKQHHALVFEHGGADTGVAIMTHEALTAWALGFPGQARQKMDAAVVCARSLAHPFTLAFALYYNAWLHKLCGDEAALREATTSAIAICDKYGFPFWGLSSAALRGSMCNEHASAEEGIAAMQSVLATYAAAGAELCRPALLCLLATALSATGHPEKGLAVLEDALVAMEKGQERWWQAEAHRLRGELLITLPGDHSAQADAAFNEALAVATRQQSPAWALRAASSLLRHRTKAGPAETEQAGLTRILDGFTEGLDTADLREARALLEAQVERV